MLGNYVLPVLSGLRDSMCAECPIRGPIVHVGFLSENVCLIAEVATHLTNYMLLWPN